MVGDTRRPEPPAGGAPLTVTPGRILGIVGVLLLAAGGTVAARPGFLPPALPPPGFRADVLVFGGSPAGVAAALAAARQGMVVVLVEPRPFLGTVLTGAMLNMVDLSRVPGGNRHLIRGIFLEVYHAMGGITFDPRQAREILLSKVEAEPGITLLLRTELVRPGVDGGAVRGARVRLPDGSEALINAVVTVDATDDGDLAASAGVPFTVGRETLRLDRRMMPATLMFRVDNLDWLRIAAYAVARRYERQPSGVHRGYVWGFRDLMRWYTPEDSRLSAHDLNIGRLPDGSALVNSLQIHDVDGTDRLSRIDAYRRAKREIPRLVAYLRENIPGFSRARLVEVAPELYIRETRHLEGLYMLTGRDIRERTRFWDRVAAASYPVDIHQYVPGERYQYRPQRFPYTIPLRSLIAARVDNLFVASRAFSATFEAAASARVIPTTMAMGEAAGVAAAVAVGHRVSPHQLIQRSELVHEAQWRLIQAGAVIDY
jgi:hypothetical protein